MRALGLVSGVMCWKNETGVAMPLDVARSIRCQCGKRATLPNARIHYGKVGSPDIIGVRRVEITQEMVGTVVGVAFGVEVKAPNGRQRPEQKHFQQIWEWRGGKYILSNNAVEIAKRVEAIGG